MNHFGGLKYVLNTFIILLVIYSMSSKWNPLIYILDKDERTVENRF